jgi:hypothetical protein
MPEDAWMGLVPEEVKAKYELHNYNSAVEILSLAYPEEYREILETLARFSLTVDDITQAGGTIRPPQEVFRHLAS